MHKTRIVAFKRLGLVVGRFLFRDQVHQPGYAVPT
jgi:hypothetical protein